MWKYTVELPGQWLTRAEALGLLGISESRFEKLVSSGLVPTKGKGNGARFDAAAVHAIGVLWGRLPDALTSGEVPSEPE